MTYLQRTLFLALIAPSFIPIQAVAWNAMGHMVIAEIAYQQLTPTAKETVDELNVTMKQDYPSVVSFDQMAVWPDMLRSQKIETFTHWHYIDNPLSLDNKKYEGQLDTDNAVWAVNKIKVILQNKHANPAERARFLAFFVHIVGDLHQPLHTVSAYSEAYPDGDKGGNLYTIQYHQNHTNLHRIWDEGLGVLNGKYSTRRAHEIASYVLSLYPTAASLTYKVDETDPDVWMKEGMVNAKKYVYAVSEEAEVSDAYLLSGKTFVEEDLVLAGERLGFMLNQMFD